MITIEAVYQDQQYVVTERDKPWDLRVKIDHFAYVRENLLNVAIRKFKYDFEYILWIGGKKPSSEWSTIRLFNQLIMSLT